MEKEKLPPQEHLTVKKVNKVLAPYGFEVSEGTDPYFIQLTDASPRLYDCSLNVYRLNHSRTMMRIIRSLEYQLRYFRSENDPEEIEKLIASARQANNMPAETKSIR